MTTGYSSAGALLGLTRTLGGTPTTLLSNVTYNGTAGANELITGASLGGGIYSFSATYDGLLRPSDLKTIRTGGSTLFEEGLGYDNAGNVATTTFTLAGGTYSQVFCYDEQDRMTWAGSQGSPPCGGSIGANTLGGATYTAMIGFDTLDRLTVKGGPSYTYGDSAHLHAATAIGTAWVASYDAAGNMTCRATGGQTCSGGSPTGTPTTCPPTATCTVGGSPSGMISYDPEGRLTGWQDAPSKPKTTTTDLYDGEGTRVQQAVTSGGTTTSTVYVGAMEDVATTGSKTTTTTYYYAAGKRIALAVNGTLSYLGTDFLAGVDAALDPAGNVSAATLYSAYGGTLYVSGTMPGSFGFTGQRSDVATTGLDYYGARYYDPISGQFMSADSVRDGLNPYGYVGGNPETHNDPSGHCPWCIGIVVGAVIGAAISYGTQVAANVASGKNLQDSVTQVNVGEIGKAALAGAIIGATGGLAAAGIGAGLGVVGVTGVAAEIGGAALTGAVEGAGGQVIDNVLHGRNWSDDLGSAALFGAVTGGLAGAAGVGVRALARRFAGAVEDAATAGTDASSEGASGAACPLSFAPETPVATPGGEHAIGSLQVGDQVTAYDPATGKTSAQTVQHVWINHDTDLLDVTLASTGDTQRAAADNGTSKQQEVAVASHGLRAPPTGDSQASQLPSSPSTSETVHTTAKHPWLTADRSWVKAGDLSLGERVVRGDGTTATIVGLRVHVRRSSSVRQPLPRCPWLCSRCVDLPSPAPRGEASPLRLWVPSMGTIDSVLQPTSPCCHPRLHPLLECLFQCGHLRRRRSDQLRLF